MVLAKDLILCGALLGLPQQATGGYAFDANENAWQQAYLGTAIALAGRPRVDCGCLSSIGSTDWGPHACTEWDRPVEIICEIGGILCAVRPGRARRR